MFGASPFGQPYFGQIAASRAALLLASATISVGVETSALTAPPALAAQPTLSIGSDVVLTSQGPLLAEATIAIGTSSPLSLRAVLAATSGVQWETVGKVIVPGTLESVAAVTLAVAPPRLAVGSVTVASAALFRLDVSATLSTLPADFRAAPGVRLGTVASLGHFGVGQSEVIISFDGAVTPLVRVGSIDITDILNEAPNTCSFICDSDPPDVGTDVKIGLQNLLVANLLFAGTVKRREQAYDVGRNQLYWTVSCEDYTYLLNRRRVFGTWTNVSATTVARAICTSYTTGFSQAGIVDGLPPVTVTWNGITVMDALSQLAGLVGGYTKVDYGKVVWLFVTDPGPSPTPVVPDNKLLQLFPPLRPVVDLSQTRTRVDVRGAETTILGPAKTSPMAFDNALAGGYTGVTSYTKPCTVTPGASLLLVCVSVASPVDVTVTFNGVPMAYIFGFGGGPAYTSYLFTLADPPPGTHPVVLTAAQPVGGYFGFTSASYVGVQADAYTIQATCVAFTQAGTASLLFSVPQPTGGGAWMVAFARNTLGTVSTISGGVLRASQTTDGLASALDSGGVFVGPMVITAAQPTNWNGIALTLSPIPTDAGITSSTVPVADASKFTSGTVISEDGQILPYTGTDPGNVPATIVGNVPGPNTGPTPALAPGVAGRLSGTYRWAIAFAGASGETTIGPPSASLFCPDVSSPVNAPGLGYSGQAGPLAGQFDYRISYLTTLGETLAGPLATRNATPLVPPQSNIFATTGISRLSPGSYLYRVTYVTKFGETVGCTPMAVNQIDFNPPLSPSAQNANGAGPLAAGAPYAYRSTFVTQDGESAPGLVTTFTPSALNLPPVGGFTSNGFGGVFGGAYYYGLTFVTGVGESAMNVQYAGTSFAGPFPGWGVNWSGSQDQNGRIGFGASYSWAASYYSDQYGEGALGPASSPLWVGGSVPVRLLMNISNFRPTGADGVRIYRAIQGVGAFLLNKEFRFSAGVPTQYWDDISQGECGSNYPIQTIRGGVQMLVTLYGANETGVIARRLYRTKAGGSEYYLVSEVQNNTQVQIADSFFDNQLATRNPPQPTTGRLALVSVPTGPAGTVARRVYRSKRDVTSVFFFAGDIRDNTTANWLDTVADASLTSGMPTTNTGGTQTRPTIGLPIGPPGVTARRLYRTKANGSAYALVAEIPDNTTGSYTDDTPDSALSGNAPPVTSILGEAIFVTSIPVGPVGTLARMVYRTKSGGGTEYGLVSRVSDNSTTTLLDAVPDATLGSAPPLTNSAGSSAVNLSNIPQGPVGVSQRLIYRTKAAGTEFHYVGSIDDNTVTTFLDTIGDDGLGRKNLDTSTVGAFVGDAFLRLDTVGGFPPAGWVHIENQFVRYGAIAGVNLTQIPARGAGAIVAPIRGGTPVLTVPQLKGVSNITTPLSVGSTLALWVVVNSAEGQAALAALIGGDGVQEYVVEDSTLDSAGCLQRGHAELYLFQYAQVSLDYATRDRLTRSGATVTAALPAPWNVNGSFIIQTVRITEIDIAVKTFPKYLVTCSNTKFSLQDLLRHVVLA